MPAPRPVVVLLHSPLVGPSSWRPVADVLRDRAHDVVVPVLRDDGRPPFWRQHADAVAADLADGTAADRPVVLVAHSGAGPITAVVADAVHQRVAGYVLVDAGWPLAGGSRLDAMHEEDPELATELAAHLEAGGRFPTWRDADLERVVPDGDRRRALVAELEPRGHAYFVEPIPTVPRWPDASGAYLLLTDTYRPAAARARAHGWEVERLDAGHFHALVDPPAVAAVVERLLSRRAGGTP